MDRSTRGNFAVLAAAFGLLGAIAATAFAQGDAFRQMLEDGRKVAVQLVQRVGGELVKEMELTGPVRSILVCKYSSPEIASELSRKTGWRISRVSLRPRNPAMGTPDAWEQQVLLDFERRAARGEQADTLEHAEIVSEVQGSYFRYMKALPVGPLCLACHGPESGIDASTKSRLANEYPHDKATGYHVGEVRGAVTIKRPL